MLKIYLFTFITSFSIFAYGQIKRNCKDYVIQSILSKSFQSVENNNIDKGIELLSQAQNCRNLREDHSSYLFSKFIEAVIFNKQKKYDKALDILTSMEDGFLHKSKDSLVVETLYLKFGKEKVLESFANIQKIESDQNNVNKHSVYLSELNFRFNFNSNEGGWWEYDKNGIKVPIYKPNKIINEKLDSVAKFTNFYRILK